MSTSLLKNKEKLLAAALFDTRASQKYARELGNFPRPNVANHCLIRDKSFDPQKIRWVVVGVPEERGVKNSVGRLGAKEGPAAFRKAFYKMPITIEAPAAHSVLDLGDLKPKKDLKESLFHYAEVICKIYQNFPKARVLVVGGGHDIAFAEIWGALLFEQKNKKKLPHHVINFDAHADLRPYPQGKVITSGTPFTLLLDQKNNLFKGKYYHPFGLQKMSNPDFVVAALERHQVDVHWLEDMIWPDQQAQKLIFLLDQIKSNPWHWNFDLDGFKMSAAPGVSAPQVLGLDPAILLALQNRKDLLQNLKSIGIYELSPQNDVADMTARLAAKIFFTLAAWTRG